jgi:hypothetical protein
MKLTLNLPMIDSCVLPDKGGEKLLEGKPEVSIGALDQDFVADGVGIFVEDEANAFSVHISNVID